MTYELVVTTPAFSILKCSECGNRSKIKHTEDRNSRYNRLEKSRRASHVRKKCGTKDPFNSKKHPVPQFYNVGSKQ